MIATSFPTTSAALVCMNACGSWLSAVPAIPESRYPRNHRLCTPNTSAAARISPSRTWPRFSGVARAGSEISPTSPRVAHTRPVSSPDMLYFNNAPLNDPSSSGWAKRPSSRFVDIEYPVLSRFALSIKVQRYFNISRECLSIHYDDYTYPLRIVEQFLYKSIFSVRNMLHLLRPIRRRILSLLRNWRRSILP